MSEQVIVVIIFLVTFAGIITEKLEKSVIALLGSLVVILGGFLTFEQATEAIDFNTIGLLLGMMLIVEIFKEIKIFDWAALRLTLLTRGNPVVIFFSLALATAAISAVLDNVTTVLITVPLVIVLTEGMGLNPRPYVLGLIFLSNIGGSVTLIGDPPNILIGSRVPSLSFLAFIEYLFIPGALSAIVVLVYLKYRYRHEIAPRDSHFIPLFMSQLVLEDVRRKLTALHLPRSVLVKASLAFSITLAGFFSHPLTHLEPAVVANLGAALLFVLFTKTVHIHHLLSRVEWPTLLFFSGLFIIVRSVEHAGVLDILAHRLVSLSSNPLVLILAVLWASAILSAIVDNIPFVAVMIPVLLGVVGSEMFVDNPKAELLWWALAIGACYGGNGTPIGASANVVSCAISSSRGYPISFKEFLRDSVPVLVISCGIGSIYLTCLYYW